jgi:FkbM family methyltransferase
VQAEGHKVHGFVTSKAQPITSYNDIPVYTFQDLPKDLRDINSIACGIFNPNDSFEDLNVLCAKHGFHEIIWPWAYYPDLHRQLGWCYWLDSKPATFESWQQEAPFRQVLSQLSDQESISILKAILAFRAGNNLEFSGYRSSEPQYFNHLTLQALPRNRPIRYLGVGAYTGDTLIALCEHVEVGQAVLLEPDPANYLQLVATVEELLTHYKTLCPYALPLGAGSSYECFALAGEGEAATFKDIGEERQDGIRVATCLPLDDMMPGERFDLVKIDVEGHDLEALKGMQNLLQRSAPVLAISLYHRPQDIVEIPHFVMDLMCGHSYDYFIRQHMNNSFDSVLYAVPRRENGRT